MLECGVHSVQAARSRDGSTISGWHVILLRCTALKGSTDSMLPKPSKKRCRPKTTAIAEAAQRQSGYDNVMPLLATNTATNSLTAEDRQLHADLYWKSDMARPRTRSTNPYSQAMYVSKQRKEQREKLLQWADISTSDKPLVASERAKKSGQASKVQSKLQQATQSPAVQKKAQQMEDEELKGEQVEDEQQVCVDIEGGRNGGGTVQGSRDR